MGCHVTTIPLFETSNFPEQNKPLSISYILPFSLFPSPSFSGNTLTPVWGGASEVLWDIPSLILLG